MKKIAVFFTALLFAVTGILAQTPNEFKYQAVLRNADGTIIADENVTVDISILQGSATGTIVFSESHSVTTTAQGLINLNIGSVSDLSIVDWRADIYFVEISVNSTSMGTSQLLSVPYALFANSTSDWTADSDTLYSAVDSTIVIKDGNVGIGTIVPDADLHIFNDDKAWFKTETGANNKWAISHLQTPSSTLQFSLLGSDATGSGAIIGNTANIDAIAANGLNIINEEISHIAFFTSGYQASDEKMRISSNGNVGIGTINPSHKLDVDGDVNISSGHSYLTNGADFAEYFFNEESLVPGDVVGINLQTGKVRKYQTGDEFVGIVSSDAGYVGNNALDRKNDSNYALVGLTGQLEFNELQVIVKNRIVKTKDGVKIGILLANGKVFIR